MKKTLDLVSTLPSRIIGLFLLIWALYFAWYFILMSFIGNLFENGLIILIYLLAFIFLVIHYLIRERHPEKFFEWGGKWIHPSQREDRILLDWIFKVSAAVSSSASIFILLGSDKLPTFLAELQESTQGVVSSYFLGALSIFIIPWGLFYFLGRIISLFIKVGKIKNIANFLFLAYILLLLLLSSTSDGQVFRELFGAEFLESDRMLGFAKYALGAPQFSGWTIFLEDLIG